MAKIVLQNVTNGYSAAIRINANSDAIESAFENTLSRDGTGPNQMETLLDMNGFRVKNLGSPQNPTDAARLIDITGLITLTGIPIPSVTGNADKLLFTDGTGIFWSNLPLASLPIFTSSTVGGVPASGGGTVNYLRADGTWAPIPAPTGVNAGIQFKNEGSSLGTSGTVTTVDFVGDGVTATRVGNVLTVTIDTSGEEVDVAFGTNEQNVNVWRRLGAPAGTGPFNVSVPFGTDITSANPSVPAMDFRGFTSGSVINLTNLGRIMGAGGKGGTGGVYMDLSDGQHGVLGPVAGRNGGTAIKGPGAGITLNITNLQGNIWGGGGGGGGGGVSADTGSSGNTASGGGGGGGAGFGRGGDSLRVATGSVNANGALGTEGTNITSAANGTGGAGAEAGSGDGGDGGAGGDWGAAGTIGGSPSGFNTSVAGGSAGLGGLAVDQNGGTVTFVSGSGSPNVKGGVT